MNTTYELKTETTLNDYASFLINKVKPCLERNNDAQSLKMSGEWVYKTFVLYRNGEINNQAVDKVLDGYYESVDTI